MRGLDASLDLVLGGRCAVCERPGRLVCPGCRAALVAAPPAPAWPDPTPPGLVTPWVAGAYAGPLRDLVLGHKERGLLGLAGPLGELLAGAAAAALADRGAAGPVVLVPVPSRRAGVRGRGHDATYRMTLRAARHLRAAAYDAAVAPLLRLRPGVADQGELDAAGRAANLAGAMTCPASRLRRLARVRPAAHLLVCDDVLTTGATLREAQRALGAAGLPVLAHAAVAATARRGGRVQPVGGSTDLLPPSPATD